MTRRRAISGLGALAAATLLAGCLGKNPNTASGPPVATINVKETEMKITPANPTIKKPGDVEFKIQNAGHIVHALSVKGPGGLIQTQQIQAGKSATLRASLNKPGKYRWYCPVGDHADRGMRGTITVGGA